MRTKIISAFPGTGKSVYHSKHPDTTLDSDSSNFSWIKDENGNNTKDRNPNFPQNYVEHIKSNIGKYKYIFVSTHKEVRDALLDNCIFFYLIYPDEIRKEEFLNRYQERGNQQNFVDLLDKNWDIWMEEFWLLDECDGFKKITMVLENLEDEIRHMERVEYGEVLDDEDLD